MAHAMGVLDYIADYESFGKKMIDASRGVVTASFPGYNFPRAPVTKFRYKMKGLPVCFHDKREVESMARMEGINKYEIRVTEPGFLLTGFVS